MAHNSPRLLSTLIEMLDDERNDIYIHIDAKSDSLFNFAKKIKTKYSSLNILNNRIDVRLGDISQVKVEYVLLKESHKKGSYLYYHLLSGVDLPIKSQDYIHDFMSKYEGKEFVGFDKGENVKEQVAQKTDYYYILSKYYRTRNNIFNKCLWRVRNLFITIQKLLGKKRKYDFVLKKGANWFSITNDFVEYLLSKESWVMTSFRGTLCCDEIFLQTLLWNSPFKSRIFNVESEYDGCLREIDWNRGWPYVWKEEDKDILYSSNKLYARKFSEDYWDIVIWIKKHFAR